MPGLIVNGKIIPTPFFSSSNYLDRPEVKLLVGRGLDGLDLGANRGPADDVRMIVLHTTKGDFGILRKGFGPRADDGLRVARFWSTQDNRGGDVGHQSGAHIVVDRDGDVHCLADLGRVCAHHAGNSAVNRNSIGIEIYQEGPQENYAVYESQLEVVVKLLDQLTRLFGIQRQIPANYRKHPLARLVRGGRDCIGIFGHRDVSAKRGGGDPGDFVFEALKRALYEPFDFENQQDKKVWMAREKDLGVEATGVPYAATVGALARTGHHPHGQWVWRPGD